MRWPEPNFRNLTRNGGRQLYFPAVGALREPAGDFGCAATLRRGGDAAENAARGFHDTSVDEEIEIPAIARVLNGASIRWGALQSQFRTLSTRNDTL